MKTRLLKIAFAACVVATFGCGEKIPESWSGLGLPLDGMKVAHGTTPTDASLFLVGPVETAPQTLCESFQGILEAKGYKADAEQLARVTPKNYNVRFVGPNDRVGIHCHSADGSFHNVDLSRSAL